MNILWSSSCQFLSWVGKVLMYNVWIYIASFYERFSDVPISGEWIGWVLLSKSFLNWLASVTCAFELVGCMMFWLLCCYSLAIVFAFWVWKGHRKTSASSPYFYFKKVEIFIPLEVYAYLVTVEYYLTCNFNSVTELYGFFFHGPLSVRSTL